MNLRNGSPLAGSSVDQVVKSEIEEKEEEEEVEKDETSKRKLIGKERG